jgi:hypothetical protein
MQHPQVSTLFGRTIWKDCNNENKNSKQTGKDPALALLEYHVTQLKGYSPAGLLMGRKIRLFVPIYQLISEFPAPQHVKQLLSSQTDLQKRYIDKTFTPLKPFFHYVNLLEMKLV